MHYFRFFYLAQLFFKCVNHYIAHEKNLGAIYSLIFEIFVRIFCGSEEVIGNMICRMRLISSGIPMSPERRPASTWATRIPNFLATKAQAIVEFMSPKLQPNLEIRH